MEKKKLKIAFLNVYHGEAERGVETFVEELATRLGEWHKVVVIAGGKKLPSRWPVLWRFFVDPRGLAIGWFTLKNLGKIWREKFDVVIPTNGGWQTALVRLVTWIYGGKMVISGQSGKGWDDRVNLWCFPDGFVAISSMARRWAKGFNPLVRSEYIPNGVDLKKFTQEGKKLAVNLGSPVVVCVGALNLGKRIDLAIRAVAEMGGASLLVVGDGELKGELENLGKKLLRERFVLMRLPHEKMPEAYRAGDVFTIPSTAVHSFEIVLVEAMATNLPVVANDDLIRREIVGEAGTLVDPTDEKVFAKALKDALEKDWGDKPRRQAEKFSWEGIAKEYEQLFLDLVK